jgi:hypothetical protein
VRDGAAVAALQELSRLSERLSKINEQLQRKVQARNEFDQTIMETEAAYMKVCACACVPIAAVRVSVTERRCRVFGRFWRAHKPC